MPKYIMLVNFTDQGLELSKRFRTGKTNRARQQNNSELNAKLFGMAFGPYDFVHLYEAPNDEVGGPEG
jgi:uncharacterized protein with GYD domain